jgi:hypothetical protein
LPLRSGDTFVRSAVRQNKDGTAAAGAETLPLSISLTRLEFASFNVLGEMLKVGAVRPEAEISEKDC